MLTNIFAFLLHMLINNDLQKENGLKTNIWHDFRLRGNGTENSLKIL
jgi:hypothetical protein